MKTNIWRMIVVMMLIGMFVVSGCDIEIPDEEIPDDKVEGDMKTFSSYEMMVKAFEERGSGMGYGIMEKGVALEAATAGDSSTTSAVTVQADYSETNVQVQGVDEADIIKTDGKYIYTLSSNTLVVSKAYPVEDAEVLSKTTIENFNPQEMFINGDKLLVFGSSSYQPETFGKGDDKVVLPNPIYVSTTTVKLYDVSDRENPSLIKTIDFEGNYLTSRKIEGDVYFVVNSYPRYYGVEEEKNIIPLYREDGDFEPTAKYNEIGYFDEIIPQSFATIASISMDDVDREVVKRTVATSGQNVYASRDNIYIAQTSYHYGVVRGVADYQKTYVHKFSLNDGDIEFKSSGEVKGHILNQFSMDEYNGDFRIATTISGYSDNKDTSTNNMYVLGSNMQLRGFIEGIAPGESIYSVRFMGKRAYMVTFRHIDPLFVIDLADPDNPSILGKLKIPGYSDYLHPYDETYLIGIGKEVDASIDLDKVHTEGAVYYTAIQGVKLAIFDVSDVENPIEMYKEVIGDRGTESEATKDHKAFLFDREKELLVVPILLAELKEGQDKSMQGDYTFQGAYVYDISLDNGFELKGRVSHYEDDSAFKKAGYYFRGDSSIMRSLYIGEVLYTMSEKKLQMNSLSDLEKLKELDIEGEGVRVTEEVYPVVVG